MVKVGQGAGLWYPPKISTPGGAMKDRVIQESVSYAIKRRISAGGMSEIYEAHQLGVNGVCKRVALKLMDPKMAEHAELLVEFLEVA
jgi:hypothetical protein